MAPSLCQPAARGPLVEPARHARARLSTTRSSTPEAASTGRGRGALAAPLLAICALAALLRFPTLDVQSFWFDEALTAVELRRPLADTIALLGSQELTPPLYFVLAWAWSRPFGSGEIGLRSLSALLGTLTVPVAYAAGAQLVSRRAGLAAAALVAVSPLLVYYSQEARPYALVILLGGVSFVLFARALDAAAGRRPLVGWAIVSALALTTHYFAVFLVAPEALWLLARSPRGQRAGALLCAALVGATGLALVPLALTQLAGGPPTWIGQIPLSTRLLEFPEKYSAGWQSAHNPAWPLPALLLGAGLVLLAVRGDSGERRGAALALALAAATLAPPLALTIGGLDLFTFRHLIVVAVPLIVGLGAGFGVRRAGRVGPIVLATLCLVSVAVNAIVFATPRLQRDDWRSASAALGRPPVPRVLAVTSFTPEPLRAYGHTLADTVPSSAGVGEIVLIGNTVPGEAVPPPPVAGFRLVERRAVQKLTIVRYRSALMRPVDEAALVQRLGLSPRSVVLERP